LKNSHFESRAFSTVVALLLKHNSCSKYQNNIKKIDIH